MSATRRYDYIPKLDLKARRFIVARLTPRAVTLGLQLGDVLEVGASESIVYRYSGTGPPRKLLDSLVVSGTLSALHVAAGGSDDR